MRGRGAGEGVRTRDHLANVRTTLAWVRMGMILMALGYAADKTAALEAAGSPLRTYGRPLGIAAASAGVVVAAAALPRFLRARARIESARFEPRPWADLALVAGLGVGVVVVLVLLSVTR